MDWALHGIEGENVLSTGMHTPLLFLSFTEGVIGSHQPAFSAILGYYLELVAKVNPCSLKLPMSFYQSNRKKSYNTSVFACLFSNLCVCGVPMHLLWGAHAMGWVWRARGPLVLVLTFHLVKSRVSCLMLYTPG